MDCAQGGASVSFTAQLTRERADAFGSHVAEGVAANDRVRAVAEDRSTVIVTVQVAFPVPSRPHRGDVAKMLCGTPRGVRLGARLIRAAEEAALAVRTCSSSTP